MKNIFIACLSLILITSCEKELNIEIPYEKDQIVLNSLFFADSNIYAKVFKSQKLASVYNQPFLSNATLTLFENGVAVGNFTKQNINFNDWYVSPKKADVGKEYKIVASATGLPTADGTDIVPEKPSAQITSVSIIANNNNIDFNRRLKLKIADDGSKENFYRIRIFYADTVLNPTGPRFRFSNGRNPLSLQVEGQDADATGTLGGNFKSEEFITDELFNGRETTLNISFDANNTGNTHFAVEVLGLSKSSYRYLKSLDQQNNTGGDPFAEAVIVFNNIKNGYGIVGATNEKLVFIRKP